MPPAQDGIRTPPAVAGELPGLVSVRSTPREAGVRPGPLLADLAGFPPALGAAPLGTPQATVRVDSFLPWLLDCE